MNNLYVHVKCWLTAAYIQGMTMCCCFSINKADTAKEGVECSVWVVLFLQVYFWDVSMGCEGHSLRTHNLLFRSFYDGVFDMPFTCMVIPYHQRYYM